VSDEDGAQEFAAFLSYVRKNDEHDHGRITELRRRLSAEVAVQTGENFLIFQDRKDILAGMRWRHRIEASIDGTTLLVAVVTPSFLKSEGCREEVLLFLEREKELRRDDLIIPILYMPTPGLWDESDEVAVDLASRQYFDWTDYRFDDPTSGGVLRAVAELAQELVAAMERSTQLGVTTPIARRDPGALDDDERPGFVELLAEAEEAMPLFTETIVAFSVVMEEITEATATATAEMEAANRRGKPSAGKLSAIHRLTKQLEEPVIRMEALAADYVDQLARVGGGVEAMVSQVRDVTAAHDVAAAKGLHEALTTLASEGGTGLDALGEFRSSLAQVRHLSSTLRPILDRMSHAVAIIQPSKAVFESWRDDLGSAIREADWE